ncbi:MAG: hypothetical protein ACTHPD_15205 [Rhizomicrobium sp.]
MRTPFIAILCLLPGAVFADDMSDIDRIPQNLSPPTVAAASPLTANLYAQADLTVRTSRDDLIVPLAPSPAWEARLFFDAQMNWQLDDAWSMAYSGRLNLRSENGLGFPDHEDIRNDLREAYIAWHGGTGFFLEAGRINLRSGVAQGFNPTDYFKTRAVVEPTSADPTVLREDRLGTVMFLAQDVWADGAFTIALAPKLANDSPPYLDTNLPSFDPMLDRTNAHTRFLFKSSFHFVADVSPELLAYSEAGRTQVGVNVTKGIGDAVVAYLEWSGGKQPSLAADAMRDGIENGAFTGAPMPVDTAKHFTNDLAIGASYATKIGINIAIEYDHHHTGFSARDWRNWFGGGHDPALPGALWFIRGYASDQQEPIARDSLFLRADWQNAFVRDLTLTGFIDADLRDGSGLFQVTADYAITPSWTVGGLVDFYYGRARSDFGSLPSQTNFLLKLSRYF